TVYFVNIPVQPVVLDGADLQNEIKVVVNVSDFAVIEDIVLFENFVCNDDLFVLHKGTIDNAQPVNDFFLMKDSQNKVAVTLVDVARISVDTQPTKTTYVYYEPFEKDGMVVSAMYNNGKTELVDINDVEILYQTYSDGFHPADTGVTLQFVNLKNKKITCTVDLVVEKEQNEISDFFAGWTYGEKPGYGFAADWVEEYDILYATSENGVYTDVVPTNAGTYWMKILVHESEFYYSAEQAFEFEIEKAVVSKPKLDSQAVVYNGQKQIATVEQSDLYTATNDGGTNAGVYVVTYSLNDKANYDWDSGDTNDRSFEFKIEKAVVSKPKLDSQSVVYNGQKQIATVEQSDLYTVANDGGTNVGVYVVTYSLNDKANYNWSNGNADDVFFEFAIKKATVTIGNVSITGNVRGEDLQVSATSNFGNAQYSFAKKGESNFTSEKPTKPGEYVVKIYVAGTDNFDGAEKTVEFVIESKLFAGEIVGIVAGSVAVAGGIGGGIWFLIKKRKRI
ncbi:MAG: bacterial Ig-like domain-containing protein, partial [Clostridia bacterium]|nr:bacterial Ig-like domain-containing protein [Clostridia bacterium]